MGHAETDVVELVVPDGIGPGDLFVCTFEGKMFEVVAPDGVIAGMELQVVLPKTTAVGAGSRAEAGEPSADVYAVGDAVKIERTNGSWSRATIVAHDPVTETYTVRLPGGALKHLVGDCSIAPLSYEPAAVGEHFDGRRVQVCRRGCDRWEDAVVRAHDSDDTYRVELLSPPPYAGGDAMLCGVRPHEIRLRTRV